MRRQKMRRQKNRLSMPFTLVIGCTFLISCVLISSPALGTQFRNFQAPSEKLFDRLPSYRSQPYRPPPPIPKVQKKKKKVIPESVYLDFQNKFKDLNPSEKSELNKFFIEKTKKTEDLMEYKHYQRLSDMLKSEGQR